MGAEAAKHADTAGSADRSERRVLVGVAGVLAATTLAMTGVFAAAGWYADNVSLARYCADPETAVARVRAIVSEARPAGDGSTRPYVVAAKLIYLTPQRAGEGADAYAARLRARVEDACR